MDKLVKVFKEEILNGASSIAQGQWLFVTFLGSLKSIKQINQCFFIAKKYLLCPSVCLNRFKLHCEPNFQLFVILPAGLSMSILIMTAKYRV